MKYGKTEKETLVLNGWGIGDVLEGAEDGRPSRILITAIGEERFLSRWDHLEGNGWESESGITTLNSRDWKKVASVNKKEMPVHEKDRFDQTRPTKLSAPTSWILVADKLPEEGKIVILEDPDAGTRYGCLHIESEGWMWAIATEPPYIGADGIWEADCSIEDGADYAAVLWHDLPSPPNTNAQTPPTPIQSKKTETPLTDAVWSATAQIDGIEALRMLRSHGEEMEKRATINSVLSDPAAVHINMLRGTIAWTPENLRHVLGSYQENEKG